MSRKADRQAKGKPAEKATFFTTDLVEAPHADADMAGNVIKRRRGYRAVILTSLVCVPVFAFVSLGNYSSLLELTAKEFPAQVTIDTPGKPTAIRAVEDWIAQKPSPLPTGYILAWDGATTQQEERTWLDEQGKEQYQHGIEIHRFTLATASGAMFTTEVQVAYGESDGAGVIGAPTLIPVAPASEAGFNAVNGWINTMPGNSSESISDAVASWVKAYTSGDPAALRIAVGDGRENISYVPMSGIEEVGAVAVKQTVVFPVDSTLPENEWVADPSLAVTRVTFTIAWPGQLNDSKSNVTSLGTLTYDLLIDEADTSAPKIVAWGSAGTGPSLKAYQNAVNGKVTADRVLTEITDDGSSPSPSDIPVITPPDESEEPLEDLDAVVENTPEEG